MTNFELIAQNETTLSDFIYAVTDDALLAKGCSMELKLLEELQDGSKKQFGLWEDWLKQEAKDNEIFLPSKINIQKQEKADGN